MLVQETLSLKDEIIEIVAKESPATLKRIYRTINTGRSRPVSYQGVHKAAKTLVECGRLQKVDGEYTLSPRLVHSITSLAETLREKGEAGATAPENYLAYKLAYRVIRLVPFYVGLINLLNRRIKVIKNDAAKTLFTYDGNLYCFFRTGVCIRVIESEVKKLNVLDLLLERRKEHIAIVNGTSHISKQILAFLKHTHAEKLPELFQYVMAVYFIEEASIPAKVADTILKMVSIPSIIGVPDNPAVTVDELHLEKVRRWLGNFNDEVRLPDQSGCIIIRCDNDEVYVSWSNIVCYGKLERGFHGGLIEMEFEVQHLWYLFHMVCNGKLRQKCTKKNMQLYHQLWNAFTGINPWTDSQSLLLKEAIIKTSRIESLFTQLRELCHET